MDLKFLKICMQRLDGKHCSGKRVKATLQKIEKDQGDPYLAMLCLRTTPVDYKLPSPAEMLQSCIFHDSLPSISKPVTRRFSTDWVTNRRLKNSNTTEAVSPWSLLPQAYLSQYSMPPLAHGNTELYRVSTTHRYRMPWLQIRFHDYPNRQQIRQNIHGDEGCPIYQSSQ